MWPVHMTFLSQFNNQNRQSDISGQYMFDKLKGIQRDNKDLYKTKFIYKKV